jgi:hypothetical protein
MKGIKINNAPINARIVSLFIGFSVIVACTIKSAPSTGRENKSIILLPIKTGN